MTRKFALIAAAFLVACAGAKPTPDPSEATPPPRPLRCDVADPGACDIEGMKFENAVGRPPSKNEAARHYAAACEAGFGPGCTHLAGMYYEKEELEQAHALYERACAAEDADGCANLGFMESRAGNTERAHALYRTACDAGSMAACANLADVHQSGRTGTPNHDEAQALFERSCMGGHSSSCIRWAWSLAQGCKGAACATPAEDEKQAASLTGSACEKSKNPVICTGHAVHVESGKYLPRDEAAARAGYADACEAGLAWGCERLGTALARGLGGPKDASGAVAAYAKACDANFATACSALGAMLLGGDGVTRDDAHGAKLVHRACELHEARACNTARLLDL